MASSANYHFITAHIEARRMQSLIAIHRPKQGPHNVDFVPDLKRSVPAHYCSDFAALRSGGNY